MDINTILENAGHLPIFNPHPTQQDNYRQNGAHERIVMLSGMNPKTYGARQEALAKIQFNLTAESSSGWDHNKLNKRLEQKSMRRDRNGVPGSYMHIEPTHEWDYLIIVRLDYQRWVTYIAKKSSIQHFVENIDTYNFITIQGDGEHSHEGYLLKDNMPDNIRQEHFTLIETEQDLIDYIQANSNT